MADYFWSREIGKFVNKATGDVATGATFTGTGREWYETLIEVMLDVINEAVKAGGYLPITDVSWHTGSTVVSIIGSSVLAHSIPIPSEEIGVIGLPRRLIVANVPLEEAISAADPSKLCLIQHAGYSGERVLGTVTVLDL